ncbi:MAG: septum site-determining protein MinC [Cellulosilyticaceae bacterium]
MGDKNLVVFKGVGDGITIILHESARFEAITRQLVEKLEDSKKFFEGARVNVKFKGRDLTEVEQQELTTIMATQNVVGVSFIHGLEGEKSEIKDRNWEWLRAEVEQNPGGMTYFHYGMVRSGQEISYPGSVVVLGDVNPGAVVSADGHIIILGNLHGKVYAGRNGQVHTPYVVALNMYPTQIGIRNVVAQSPDWGILSNKKKNYEPQIAYLVDEQIYVDEIDFKTLNHMIQ